MSTVKEAMEEAVEETLEERIGKLSPAKQRLVRQKLQEQKRSSSSANGLGLPNKTGIPRRHSSEPAPLSFGQARLWFIQQLEPEQSGYSRVENWRLSGSLNREALERTLVEIARRHEPMRTKVLQQNGEPLQIAVPAEELPISTLDLRHMAESKQNAVVKKLLNEQSQKPFDLAKDLPWRFFLIQLHETEHILLRTTHHIATDGWSWNIFKRELSQLYSAFVQNQPSPLPEVPLRYTDFAIWQRQQLTENKLDQQLAYWREQLAELPVLQLPLDRPRPSTQTFDGATVHFDLPEQLVDQLRSLSKTNGSTLFMTLLAAFNVLLYRYSIQTDIAVGSPIAGRNRHELESLIGFFVNTLVLRTQLDPKRPFDALLNLVKRTTLDAYAHQELSFEKLVEELQPERNPSYPPLCQVNFVFQSNPRQALNLTGLDIEIVQPPAVNTAVDLTLNIRDQPGRVQGLLIYNTDLFDEATVARMAAHFTVLLEGIVNQPELPIQQLPMLTDAEYHQIVHEWNNTAVDFGEPQTIHALFEQQVERNPDAVAVVFEGHEITYRSLNERANQLAHYLIDRRVGPDVLVGISIERSIQMIIAVLGILKAGGAYVPFDPTYPRERLQFMFEDANVSLLVTTDSVAAMLPKHHAEIVSLSQSGFAKQIHTSTFNPTNQATSDNLAYILYTSGSTGTPKAVTQTHHTLYNLVSWQQNESDGSGRTLQFAPINFDISVQEFFTTLCVGGTLVMIDLEIRRDPFALLAYLKEQAINRLFIPFPLLQQLAEAGDSTMPSTLKEVIQCGEALQITPEIKNWFRESHCILFNHYGPTESHVVTSYRLPQKIEQWSTRPSIGCAVANTSIYILDDNLAPVPVGIPGELHIGRVQLARGYLNRPELTTKRFIDHPEFGRLYKTGDLCRWLSDGSPSTSSGSCIEFLGRTDFQVKIRGFRVELGEIENVLLAQEGVREAVVLAREDNPGDKQLVAYIGQSGKGAELQSEEDPVTLQPTILREALAQQLPDYMIPSAFVFLETMPMTPNGKLDRRAFPAPDYVGMQSEFVTPRNKIEQQLAAIWQEVLGIEQVGIYNNFFELGGHSLLTVKLMMQVEQKFSVTIPLKNFFAEPTIAHIASRLTSSSEPHDPCANSSQLGRSIFSSEIDSLYNSVGVPGALSDHRQPRGGRRWYLIHHTMQRLPRSLRLHLARQVAQQAIHKRLFRDQSALTLQFLALIETEVDKAEALQKNLTYGFLHKYRASMVSNHRRKDPQNLDAWQIDKARSQGQGVLVLRTHTTLQHWCPRLPLVQSHIGGVHHLVQQDDPDYEATTNMLFTRQLDYARQTLQKGGVAQIVADGQQGQGKKLEFNFHGRRRPFMAGFAELALATDALVVPIVVTLDEAGEFKRYFGKPLDAGDADMPHSERVEHLVAQYVAFLSQMWSESPWLVPWYQMERHLAYPSSTES